MYLLALLLPPVALFAIGKIFQGIFNLILLLVAGLIVIGTLGFGSGVSFVLWIVCIIHAMVAVRNSRLENTMRRIARESGGDNA